MSHRDFGDAMTMGECVAEVDVMPDGSIWDEDEQHFGPGNW